MKYRKKPIVIEAYQIPPNDHEARMMPPRWLVAALLNGSASADAAGGLSVHTPEGIMRADVDDWVIQGIKGELYPCKPDVFSATYEPVED